MIIPSGQPSSVPCSDHLALLEGGGDLGEECRLSFVHRNVIKLTYSFLIPGAVVRISGLNFIYLCFDLKIIFTEKMKILFFSFSPLFSFLKNLGFQNLDGEDFTDSLQVAPPPFSLTPLILLSGPSTIQEGGGEVCWEVEGKRTGRRGMTYIYSGDLEGRLMVKEGNGWIGGWMGGERICVEDWSGVEGGRGYWLGVEGVSQLWGSRGRGGVMVFVEERGGGQAREEEKKREEGGMERERNMQLKKGDERQVEAERQIEACGLWESDPEDLYGILTYPSGEVYWGESMREEGVTVLLKGLVRGCDGEMISAEILAAGNVSWDFLEGAEEGGWDGVNLDDYSKGTRLFLPSTLLLTTFSPSLWVRIQVTFQWGEGSHLATNFSFLFLPGGVEFILEEDPGVIVEKEGPLVLDFGSSLVQDEKRGLIEDGYDQQWEWLWRCINPLSGGNCVYSGGGEVVMPGRSESKFVAEGEFVVGEPLLFVVSAKVVLRGGMEGEGGGVSRGKWTRVFNAVEERGGGGEAVLYSEWGCLGSGGENGFSVCFLFIFSLFFFSFLLFFSSFLFFSFLFFSFLFFSFLFFSFLFFSFFSFFFLSF